MKKYIILVALIAAMSCAQRKVATNEQNRSNEPFIIYKTKANYNKHVPVTLNADKSAIVSYPGPYDLSVDGNLSIPTELLNGYLLDNRGINLNVAFTSYTYEEYVQRDSAPSISELFGSIIDKDPLLEMYNCEKLLNIKGDIKKINKMIKKGFVDCQRIK